MRQCGAQGDTVARAKNQQVAEKSSAPARKTINLALQGGGAHGAFGWGVMDKFLEDGRLEIEGITAASAGSMNAVVYAYGKLRGNDGAREALQNFWKAVSDSGQRYSFKPNLWQKMWGMDLAYDMMSQMGKWMASSYSPYQLNPFNYNPLRDILEQQIDFAELERSSSTKLFISATNVRTGKPKVFYTEQINADIVMASACLPQLFHAVEIEGEHYWDGGYMGNPVLYPLFYHTKSVDVVILHIVPIERNELPQTRIEIDNRVNEITFNCALMKEMRAIVYVQKLINDGWFKEEFVPKLKYIYVHSVRADRALSDLSLETKVESDWGFLTMLRDRGRACAAEWLERNFDDVGIRSTVDMQKDFL